MVAKYLVLKLTVLDEMPAFPEKESSLLAKLKKYKVANAAGAAQNGEEESEGAPAKALPAAKVRSNDNVANGDAPNNVSGRSSPANQV